MNPAAPWTACPIVYVLAAACPACGSLEHINVRTEQNGDGSKTRKRICRQCSTRFLLVVEVSPDAMPEAGKRYPDTL